MPIRQLRVVCKRFSGGGRRRAVGSDDSGSIILVLILSVALIIASVVAVSSVTGGISTAQRSTAGGQAVAQANAGVSDALARLDQMGRNVTRFCVGAIPQGVALPYSAVTVVGVPCSPIGPAQLLASPGLAYYSFGVGNGNWTGSITSIAQVGGATRIATANVYQVQDRIGLFAVSSMSLNGALGQSSVSELGGGGVPISDTGTVAVGTGPSGSITCSGNVPDESKFVWIGGSGATLDGCGSLTPSGNLVPADPTVCDGALSTAFAPCIDAVATGFATSNGEPYCPIPGITGLTPGVVAAPGPTVPPSGAVYDCQTMPGSGPVSISTTQADSLPAGSYYITANSVTVGSIDSSSSASAFGGPANFFIFPNACYSGQPGWGSDLCAAASAGSPTARTGCASSAPPAQSLALSGPINYLSGGATSGDPADMNIFWAGCGPVSLGTGAETAQLAGALYAPGGTVTVDSHFTLVGSMVVGSFMMEGTPTLDFTYAELTPSVMQGWTEVNYAISY